MEGRRIKKELPTHEEYITQNLNRAIKTLNKQKLCHALKQVQLTYSGNYIDFNAAITDDSLKSPKKLFKDLLAHEKKTIKAVLTAVPRFFKSNALFSAIDDITEKNVKLVLFKLLASKSEQFIQGKNGDQFSLPFLVLKNLAGFRLYEEKPDEYTILADEQPIIIAEAMRILAADPSIAPLIEEANVRKVARIMGQAKDSKNTDIPLAMLPHELLQQITLMATNPRNLKKAIDTYADNIRRPSVPK